MKKHTFDDLSTYSWRRVGSVQQRKVTIRVDEYGYVGSPDELSQRIAEANLQEPVLEVESEEDYGSCSVKLTLSGWRAASDDEIREALDEMDEREEKRLSYHRRMLEEIRNNSPELLEES